MSSSMRSYVIGGLVLGAGAVLVWRMNARERGGPAPVSKDGHWSTAERVAVGAIGGGLMIYGMRASGRVARIASTAGLGMVARSVTDRPIHDWKDVIKPQALLMA